MAIRTFGASIEEFYGETLTIDTAIRGKGFLPGAEEVMLEADGDARLQFGPRIEKCLVSTDSGSTFTNYTPQVRDRNTATSLILDDFDTATEGNYLYIAAKSQFEGVEVDVGAANGTVSALSGYYWDGDSWEDLTITDNTASSSKTLAVDQTITWTRPASSAWKTTTLDGISGLYVVRFQVDVQLDDEVEIDELALLPNISDAPAGYFAANTDYVMTLDPAKNGSIAGTAASSKTLNITWIRHRRLGSA
jgi:hypothetical protein